MYIHLVVSSLFLSLCIQYQTIQTIIQNSTSFLAKIKEMTRSLSNDIPRNVTKGFGISFLAQSKEIHGFEMYIYISRFRSSVNLVIRMLYTIFK